MCLGCMQAGLEAAEDGLRGVIVNTASIAAFEGNELLPKLQTCRMLQL